MPHKDQSFIARQRKPMMPDLQREATITDAAVSVAAGNNELLNRARSLAQELNLPFNHPHEAGPQVPIRKTRQAVYRKIRSPRFLLLVTPKRLELVDRAEGGRPIYVDFVRGRVAFRRRSDLSHRQPLAAAVGIKRGAVSVVDATAGLGRDAFLLACLGCRVTAIERSPVLYALLCDGLERALGAGDSGLRSVVARISLLFGDSRKVFLRFDTENTPDVIYLDPMYVPRRKSTRPAKELRICRMLVGNDPDAAELLAAARRTAAARIAVKRHIHAPPLAPEPALSFTGKQVRYDVYLRCGHHAAAGTAQEF